MVRNFVLRRRVSGAGKRNFRSYNRLYTSPNEHFEYGYPHSNALFNISSSMAQYFAPNWSFVSNVKQLRQPITSDVTYDVGAPTVYRRIFWRKYFALSNQTSHYIRKCIRIQFISSSSSLKFKWQRFIFLLLYFSRITGSRVRIPLEARFFPKLNGASLHTAFHVHHSIVSIWLKYCWRDVKP